MSQYLLFRRRSQVFNVNNRTRGLIFRRHTLLQIAWFKKVLPYVLGTFLLGVSFSTVTSGMLLVVKLMEHNLTCEVRNAQKVCIVKLRLKAMTWKHNVKKRRLAYVIYPHLRHSPVFT